MFTRWGIRKLKMMMVSLSAVALLGIGFGSASGANLVTLDECRRSGGHESGKYCSGGGLNGSLIREFILTELDRFQPAPEGGAKYKKACKRRQAPVQPGPRRCGWGPRR